MSFIQMLKNSPLFFLLAFLNGLTAAQDFTVESPTDGAKFTLSDAKGKVVALHFLLKTECPYCLSYTRSYAAKSASTPEIVHVFLKPDGSKEIKKWAAHLDTKELQQAPVIYRDANAKLAKAYQIPKGYKFHGQSVHYPALVVLGPNGQELFRYVGKNNVDRMSYEDFEKTLLDKFNPADNAPNDVPEHGNAKPAESVEFRDLVPQRLLALIHAFEVQQELKLSPQQITSLETCFQKLDGPWFRSRNQPAEKQWAELEQLEAEFWGWADANLMPSQVDRLKQLELQALGSRMLLRNEVARTLELTSSQLAALSKLARVTDSALQRLQEMTLKGQATPDLQKAINDASEAEQRAVNAELSDTQRQRLTRLLGARFDVAQLKRTSPMAPEFASDTRWINSGPVTLHSLRGQVVIVHFYAFECHNCHANFEIYRRWHDRWHQKGVTVIGIQSPETRLERDPEAIQKAAEEQQLVFPIIVDTEMKNWNAWANTMWPTVYVIDRHGYLRWWWQGELTWQGATGDQQVENLVEQLLTEKTSSLARSEGQTNQP
jgi:peroxiredoxin